MRGSRVRVTQAAPITYPNRSYSPVWHFRQILNQEGTADVLTTSTAFALSQFDERAAGGDVFSSSHLTVRCHPTTRPADERGAEAVACVPDRGVLGRENGKKLTLLTAVFP